jgi:hypothetical protein
MEHISAGTLVAVTVAGVAAGQVSDSLVSCAAVITVGSFGGAVFALTKAPLAADSVRRRLAQAGVHMVRRGFPSLFLSGFSGLMAQDWLVEHQHNPSMTFLLLAVSFTMASYRELWDEFAPLWSVVGRLRGKE